MDKIEKVPLFGSQRFALAILAFLGNVFIYATRVNLSVAIVCIVRDVITSENSTHIVNGTTVGPALTTVSSGVTDQVVGGFKAGPCGRREDLNETSTGSHSGEFDWDKSTQSELLAMYFYGYIFLQLPSGWLASRYGGKRVWGVCQAVCAVCTLLTPLCARTSVYLAYALRFLIGFAAGVTFPCVHALLGRWSPPLERSKMASITFAGPRIGSILTFSISGLLCEYGFDNGWGSIFYLAGLTNVFWVVAWFLLVADAPEKHKHISEKELTYITASIGEGAVKVRTVPWKAMFTSGPLWAVIIGHFGNNYLNYTLMTSLPLFMKESLNFDIEENGVLSSLPYACQCLASILVGYMADTLRERKLMSTKNVRKLFQTISLGGAGACAAIVGQLGCSQRYWAVAMLCLCTSLMSGNIGGYLSNHLDLAPSYAGILFGITNTAGTIPGIIAPIVAGLLTPNGEADEWRNVFYLCTAVALTAMLLYLVLADGELQDWAVPREANQATTVGEDSGKETPGDETQIARDEKTQNKAQVEHEKHFNTRF